MHLLPGELVQAIDLGVRRLVQLSDSRDQEVTLDLIRWVEFRLFATTCRGDLRPPLLQLIVPPRFLNGGVEADVLVQLVLLRDSGQVGEDLFLAWVLPRPVAVLSEAVAVER